MRPLTLYDDYNREDIHGIFSPHTNFTPSAGTWGLQGLIRIEGTKDFVFIVTQGTVVGDHTFDEGFTENGLFRWQSQPNNTLQTQKIIDLINHDETTNKIYLFYRKEGSLPYTYLGTLKYLNHDNESGQDNNPVNFNWQLLSWPIPEYTLNQLQISLEKGVGSELEQLPLKENLQLTNPPETSDISNRAGLSRSSFQVSRIFNNPETDRQLKEIGDEGELCVIKYEKEKLIQAKRSDLVDSIIHIAKINDAAGYDILSYDESGNQIFIEVKTTQYPIRTDFFISPGEIKFSKDNKDNYFLYRVYNFDRLNQRGHFFITKGNVEENFNLKPINYKVSI